MGNFSNNAITDVGRMLLADVQAGAVFTPTRIVMGSGSMPAGATAQSMTHVITTVKSLDIVKKLRTPDGKCIFGGVYTNEEVTEPFYFRELALYAKAVYLNADGSVQSEGEEKLYSYGNAGATADYMPAYSTSTVVEKNIDLVTWIGNDAKVDLTIESGIYAPAGYGLGVNATPLSITNIADLDPFNQNGWFSFVLPGTTQVNGVNFQYGYMRVDNFDSYSCTQTIYVVDAQGTILRRKKMNNAWGEFECENPPFAADVEYRTTERRNGKAVYKKLGSDGVLKYRLDGEAEWNTYAKETGAIQSDLMSKLHYVQSNEEIDEVIEAELLDMADNSVRHLTINDNIGNTFFGGGVTHITIYRANYYYATVEAIRYYANGAAKWLRCKHSTWLPWEWDNPAIDPGTEYRTTDRYHGVAVYKKVDASGNILWRKDGESQWRLQASASYVAAATVE
jgi:hypothetical protein